MKRIVALCLVVAFSLLLSQLALCERPARPQRAEGERPAALREEVAKLMKRLQELNEQLRGAAAKARQNEEVRKAFEKARELREALAEAQKHANELLEEAIVKENPDLAKAVKQRKAIEEKLREIRMRSAERRPGLRPRGGRTPVAPQEPSRLRPAAGQETE